MAKLAGGKDKLLQAARDALAEDDNQWAAQLADHLLAIDSDDHDGETNQSRRTDEAGSATWSTQPHETTTSPSPANFVKSERGLMGLN